MDCFIGLLSKIIRRGYALIFALVFVSYIGVAALPAYLIPRDHKRAGLTIYQVYHFLCHQYPWRSYFLGGPQVYYPLFPDEKGGLMSFEEASGLSLSENNARSFYGTPEMGYKMALCQRDVAIYGSMAVFCLLFFITGNRMSDMNWKIWLILAVVPMGIDGGTQLISQMFPALFSFRESTPLLRTITGIFFGFFTCWFLFPKLEHSLLQGDTI